jgi:hypothetical protein
MPVLQNPFLRSCLTDADPIEWQDEMASLLAGLAAAEKIQTGQSADPEESTTSSPAVSVKSKQPRRPAKSSKKKKRKDKAGALGTELSSIAEGTTVSCSEHSSSCRSNRPASLSQFVLDQALLIFTQTCTRAHTQQQLGPDICLHTRCHVVFSAMGAFSGRRTASSISFGSKCSGHCCFIGTAWFGKSSNCRSEFG